MAIFQPPRCTPGTGLLVLIALLLLLSTISVPYIRTFDVVRTYFGGSIGGSANAVNEIRLGLWGYCTRQESNGDWICDNTGLSYSYEVQSPNGKIEIIGKSWTRGLVMLAVATAFTWITLLLSLTHHHIISALAAWFSAVVTFIFLMINVALYAYVHHKMNDLGVAAKTNMGNAFWMSLAAFIALWIAGSLLLVEHRRVRAGYTDDTTYGYGRRPGIFSRFRS